MKKQLLIFSLLTSTLLNASTFIEEGSHVSKNKDTACNLAFEDAKKKAVEKSKQLVFSQVNMTKFSEDFQTNKKLKSQLSTLASEVLKLEEKKKSINPTQDYQYTCNISAQFSVDENQLNDQINSILKKNSPAAIEGYFQAEGYSEEGQSRYAAFTVAKVVAQRNLLEVIKGSELTSLTKVSNGMLESDRIGTLISGALKGAHIIKKEYDSKTKSAMVVIQISKSTIAKILEKELN